MLHDDTLRSAVFGFRWRIRRLEWLAQGLLAARRYDESIAVMEAVLKEDPDAPMARGTLQQAYAGKHMYDQALAQNRQAAASSGDAALLDALDRGYRAGGYRGAMHERAELAVHRFASKYMAPTTIAAFYVSAGENGPALDWLETAYRDHDIQMVKIRHNPRWDPLRDQPRFRDLVRRMNFPN